MRSLSVYVFTESPRMALHVSLPAVELASLFNERPGLIVPFEKKAEIDDLLKKKGWSEIILLKGIKSDLSYDYAYALSQFMKEITPKILMIPATKEGKEIASITAALLNAVYASEVVKIFIENGSLKFIRPVLGGGILATYKVASKSLIIATYKPYLYPPAADTSYEPKIIEFEVKYEKPKEITNIVRIDKKPLEKTVDLKSADRIVAVGRGLAKKEDLSMIFELAKLLKAEVGCSRVISEDYGWLPVERQVGLSGVIVSPKLYIAIGISGQIQHVIGFKNSRIVVSINKDKDAPIHKYADYIIIDDLYKIVPALINKLKQNQ
jgi:electron transfer flavoprotein alpha subunit